MSNYNESDTNELNSSKLSFEKDVYEDAVDTFRGVYINKGFDEIELDKPPKSGLNGFELNNNNNSKNSALGLVAKKQTVSKTSLVWNNLSYEVIKKKWTLKGCCQASREVTLKQILKPQNGEIIAGTLTALMGPSGAGKSTLLNCLTGRYVTGVRGDVSLTFCLISNQV